MDPAQTLALLQCPATGQPLRVATAQECARAGFAAGLSTADGRRIYPVLEGIPRLCVSDGRLLASEP